MRNVFAALLVLALTGTTAAAPAATSTKAGIDVFNDAFDQATRAMDDQATLALWEDDGVSLLPGTAPMIGKPALATFLAEIRKQIPGGRMQTFESRCFDLQASCDLASEWCEEHQIVTFADGKPTFDGRGKMLLVLHRGSDGHWRLRQEMWNQAAPLAAR